MGQAGASARRDLDAADLASLIGPVALDLLGELNWALSSKRELRYGNNGSLAVTVAGAGAGQWYSFEDDRGGGVFDLIACARRHPRPGDALAEAAAVCCGQSKGA